MATPTVPTETDTSAAEARAEPFGALPRIKRVFLSVILLVCYTYALITDPSDMPGWTVCPTRLLTDVPCPSCGFGRGFVLISHGHMVEALVLNVWAPVAFAVALPVALWLLVEAIAGVDRLDRTLRAHKKAVYIGVAVLVVVRYAVLLTWG